MGNLRLTLQRRVMLISLNLMGFCSRLLSRRITRPSSFCVAQVVLKYFCCFYHQVKALGWSSINRDLEDNAKLQAFTYSTFDAPISHVWKFPCLPHTSESTKGFNRLI